MPTILFRTIIARKNGYFSVCYLLNWLI